MVGLNLLPVSPQIREAFQVDGRLYLRVEGQVFAVFKHQQVTASLEAVSKSVQGYLNQVASSAPGHKPPEALVYVPMGSDPASVGGNTQVSAEFAQSLQVEVLRRAGAPEVNEAEFRYLLDRLVGAALEKIRLEDVEQGKQFQVMLGNMATLSDTMGEVKKLATQSRDERYEAVKHIVEDWERHLEGKEWEGKLGANFLGFGADGDFRYKSTEEKERLRKEHLETLQKGFDELSKSFDGSIPTVTGIRVNQSALSTASSSIRASLKESTARPDWYPLTWPRITVHPLQSGPTP
jgi:hypothetical protein